MNVTKGATADADYRAYLRNLLKERGTNPTQLARAIGKGKTWASYVMRGRRRLTTRVAQRVADALSLGPEPRSRFLAMVEIAEGSSEIARDSAESVLLAHKAGPLPENIDNKVKDLVSQWHVGAILTLARCEGYRPDAAWVAATLVPAITEEEASQALLLLRDMGLLDENFLFVEENPGLWATAREITDGELARTMWCYHKAAFSRIALATSFRSSERMLVNACLALGEESFLQLRTRMEELVSQAVRASLVAGAQPTRLYQLTLTLFPASLYTDTEYDPREV